MNTGNIAGVKSEKPSGVRTAGVGVDGIESSQQAGDSLVNLSGNGSTTVLVLHRQGRAHLQYAHAVKITVCSVDSGFGINDFNWMREAYVGSKVSTLFMTDVNKKILLPHSEQPELELHSEQPELEHHFV